MLEYENKEWLEKKYLEEKKSSIEIAKMCDCTKPTILRWMRNFGIEPRPSGRSVKGKEIFKNKDWLYNKYWNENKSAVEIGEICSCAQSSILRWMEEFNIKIRLPGKVTKSNKIYRNENWLRKKYLDEKKSSLEIAKICNCAKSVVLKWMEVFGIERRSISEACKGRILSEENKRKIGLTIHKLTGNHCILSQKAREWIDGELLGDGCLISRSKYSVHFSYTSKYKEYINYVSDMLKSFGIKQSGKVSKFVNKEHGAISYRYSSCAYAELLPIRKRWYPKGVKIIPKNLELTPLTLRQEYIGDGCLCKPRGGNPYINLATCGFMISDVEGLVDKLNELGFKTTRRPSNNTINISTYSTRDFLNYIGFSPVTCYSYKWMV